MEDSNGLLVVERWKIVKRVIASLVVEDSVAVNIAVAKGLLWWAIKGNKVSTVYINGACPHITFAHRGIDTSYFFTEM